MGQDQRDPPHLAAGPGNHRWTAADDTGKADIIPRMGDNDQPQLSGPLQNAQIAHIVKIHALVDRVELDDVRYLRILERAGELGLIIVTHRCV